jgi:formimidoylglutamate deiminase
VHMHAAEQVKEVEDCVAWSGARPVEWLLDHMQLDARWCLIHTTHMTEDETDRLAASGATAGLCPLTEASLGDGIFNGTRYLAKGGHFGVGTDSNIDIDAALELRQLEYSQRLAHRGRNLMTGHEGESNGQRLVYEALRGGARALGRPAGRIAPGMDADIVVLDRAHPEFAFAAPERWLDAWIFVAARAGVRSVFARGREVVRGGRHRAREAINRRYLKTLRALVDG